MDKPTVICLCGSTRFADQHAVVRWELEKQGHIVLMINYLPAWYADCQGWNGNDHFGEASGLKDHLDELHLRKIDLSDRVFVVNVDGYIGDSTRQEIAYAEAHNKPVAYLETGRVRGQAMIERTRDEVRKHDTRSGQQAKIAPPPSDSGWYWIRDDEVITEVGDVMFVMVYVELAGDHLSDGKPVMWIWTPDQHAKGKPNEWKLVWDGEDWVSIGDNYTECTPLEWIPISRPSSA